MCVGRADGLAEPGDQLAVRIGDEGALLVRDTDGTLNAFANTCRHRGHELLQPGSTRNLRAIKCPYHAWVYGLDGALNGAPRFGDVSGFDKADHPLIPVAAAEWNGWLFVNTSGDAPASRSRGGCDRAASARARSRGTRTRSTSSWRWWPAGTWTDERAARRRSTRRTPRPSDRSVDLGSRAVLVTLQRRPHDTPSIR